MQRRPLQFSVLLRVGLVLFLGACQDNSQSPPSRPDVSAEDEPAATMLTPVDLVYVCGNKFLATNSTSAPITVRYRVVGTNETGSVTLPQKPPGGDPWFSETELETVERGLVELYQDDDRVARRQNQGQACGTPGFSAAMVAGVPSSAGQWSAPFPWLNIAVHLTLLPTGKVISFGLTGTPQVWDPANGTFKSVPSPSLLFCAGQSLLADGRLLVAGGNNNPTAPANGLPNINLFTPASESWTTSVAMQHGRWYPTTTTLANGDVVILAGKDEVGTTVRVPEVWSSGTLRSLSTAGVSLPLYPRTFLAPNGKIFLAGENAATKYLDPTNTGSWTPVATRKYGQRDYGSAVMYDDGKILYVGGGRTTNTAEIIDLNSGAPAWQWTGSMAYRRRHLNATVLPTGEVLVTGGSSGTAFNDPTAAVHAAELWNPATGVWRTLASNSINRVYHSTSILLPDGRILHTGSGDAGPDQRNAELFSPPYLFLGPRPTITAAPTLVGYGASFSVTTPDAANIAKVSLIRLGSTTHAFDMNQRFQWLSFARQTGALTISTPTSANRAPPGHYMLFILDGNGVPSVARILKLSKSAEPPPPVVTLAVTGRTTTTSQYMILTWTGARGTTVDVYRDGALLTKPANTGRYTNIRAFLGAATYRYKVCETASLICSNEATIQFSGRTAPPIPLNVVAWTEPTRQHMRVEWSGATGTTVDVYRNDRRLTNTLNDGLFGTTISFLGPAAYIYKVCEGGTTICSEPATVQYGNVAPVSTIMSAARRSGAPPTPTPVKAAIP